LGDQSSSVASLVVAFDQPVQLDSSALTLALHTNSVSLSGVLQPAGFGSLPTSLSLSTSDNVSWIVTFLGNTDKWRRRLQLAQGRRLRSQH
jgi:hypothetical protein